MSISDVSLKRAVGAIVLSLGIILLGVVGFNFLGVRLYPNIDPPIITVQTSYTGASAQIIESQITEPLEKNINGIEGVKSISSTSSTGSSSIVVEFDLGADLEKAANDVRNKVSQAQRQLPQDLDAPPTVTKSDANSDPIIMLSIRSTNMNPVQLSEYAENVLQERLQTIPGVSSVNIYGLRRPAMRLWMDPMKMAAYGITAEDVSTTVRAENVDAPGGKIKSEQTELLIQTKGRLLTEDDFSNMIIRQTNDQIVRFSDIGRVELGAQDEESQASINGVPGLILVIIPLPGANAIQIADEFHKRMDQIKETLPEGTLLEVARDKSVFVRQAVKDVIETLAIAIFLVALIIFLFFRNWIIALRPLIDIPVSLIGTFFIMYILGFTVNVLTLLGIVLATGLVVDDGIVVTENIFKRIEKGVKPYKAAQESMREIFFVVVSTSLTLAIVFIPVIFLQGFTGRLFREFGIVVASAVLISALVSLTLTPVLNVFMGGSASHHSRFYVSTEPFFQSLENGYRKGLTFFIKYRWLSYLIISLSLAIIFIMGAQLKSELAPTEDHSFLRTNITAPEGASFEYTHSMLDRITQFQLDSFPEINIVQTRYGGGGGGISSSNGGGVTSFLSQPDERKRTQQQIYEKLTNYYRQISYARVIASQEPTISTSSSRGLPVQFVIQNLNFEKIREVLPLFLDQARSSAVFSNVDVDLKFNKPEVDLSVDRQIATNLGLNQSDISDALNYTFSGGRIAYFMRNNKQYYVIAQVDRANREKTSDITSLYIRNKEGKLIQLDNVMQAVETSNPPAIYHYNRYKSATISANLAKGYTLGDGLKEMNRIADNLLDNSFSTALSGPSRDFAESSSNISFALILALLMIYLILAAQFESFRDPFIIMITVPLAIAGAILSLYLFGFTLNIFSEIGIIMLIGIVTKNGILIVEFANQKRKAGLEKIPASLEAAVARFRPILMTSLATIFGAFPIAFALGAGAESRVPLGVVVVGGLTFSLILTLFVIPVMYILMANKNIHRHGFED